MNKNLLANIIGKLTSALLMLISLPFLIKAIGTEGYAIIGVFTAIQSVLMLLDGGVSAAYTKKTSELFSNRTKVCMIRNMELYFLSFFKISIVVFFLSLALFLYFSQFEVANINQINMLMSASLSVMFMQIFYQASMCSTGRQRSFNITLVMFGFIRYPLIAACVIIYELSILSYFVLFLLANIFYIIALHFQTTKTSYFSMLNSLIGNLGGKEEHRSNEDEVFKRNMLLLVIMSSVFYQSDKLILAKFVNAEMLGAYSLAFTIASFPMVFTSAFYYYLFPKLVFLKDFSDKSVYQKETLKNTVFMMVGISSVCIYLAFYSYEVLSIYLGNELLAGEVGKILFYLILGSLLQGILMIPYCAQLAIGKISYLVKLNAVFGISMLVSQVLLAKYSTPNNVALSWLIYNCFVFCGIFKNLKFISDIQRKWHWLLIGVIIPLTIVMATIILCESILNSVTVNKLLVIIPSGFLSMFLKVIYTVFILRKIDAK
ncbi:lipopolysaccharide biosynthesis protein [Enterovibrio norvegicus]|uniref:lipopolysaccharide biosynthesis protein n=1 Tax=Enterovibrio norvegicus TaxID=188144 RepID=UPI003553353C